MKYILVCFLFLLNGNPIDTSSNNTFQLPDDFKHTSTFSGKINEEDTFHLVVAKHKKSKTFSVFPLVISQKKLINLSPINLTKQPNLVSYHQNNDVLTLIVSYKLKRKTYYTVIDVDVKKNTHKISDPILTKNLKTEIKQNNQSILVFSKNNSLTFLVIKDALTKREVTVSDSLNNTLVKNFAKGNVESIMGDDFIANGSILSNRIYTKNNSSLVLTNDNESEGKTSFGVVDLNGDKTQKIIANTLNTRITKSRKTSSFVLRDRLFQINLNNKSSEINIININNVENEKKFNLTKLKNTKKTKGFLDLKSFLKEASRPLNHTTITANPTINGSVGVRIDYVLKENYIWNWHHWHWHNQQFMNRQINPSLPRFGPNDSPFFEFAQQEHYVEFLISTDNELVGTEDIIYQYKEVDKKAITKSLKANKNIEHVSVVFFNNHYTICFFDKKSEFFEIKSAKYYND